ncbi:hypothetical protein EDC01DRAFT_483410 [Geopyxis carbonaria]|nr:hypothetical protein EDC01DRAFT_483410 [Geopyxis carbonaria]
MMKNIRRSMKGERSDHFNGAKISHISITPKSALTITPPKKVIKALDAYNPSSDQELGFEKGDFFHVIGNEGDTEWYEACNPATGARGFVPVPYFQVLGKNERDSQDSSNGLDEKHSTDKDSGYSDRGMGMPDRIPERNGTGPQTAAQRNRQSKAGSPLYGVVLYDFKAERPDELEANTGEDIIVIAQSNEEWFVAKPIGRLGGPGLIPVDFIEIRDMVTGEVVQDTKAAIARAGVPRVEEWKKMAAEYKNSSIALGQFEFDDPSAKMRDMTLNGGENRQTLQPYGGSVGQDPYRNSRSSSQGLLSAPVSGSVESYNYENGRYWYVVKAIMEDGKSWGLCRFYEDFYDFQIALLDEFKEEAGHTGHPRILPYMPGPVTYVTDTISAARRQSLDEYIKKLLSMPPYISKCRLVKLLFAPRPGDVETNRYDHRQSAGSQHSSDSSRAPSRQSSAHNLNGNNGYPGLSAPPARTSQQQGRSNGIAQAHQVHMRSGSDLQPPRMLRQDSSMSATTANSSNSQPGFLKIKIEYQDEMIAVKLPKDVNFAQLQDKLQERLGTNLSRIQYKDEASGHTLDMIGDNDLNAALSRNPKLKLFVE